MATRYYCDCCGEQVDDEDAFHSADWTVDFLDGHDVHFDELCLQCVKGISAAIKRFVELKGKGVLVVGGSDELPAERSVKVNRGRGR